MKPITIEFKVKKGDETFNEDSVTFETPEGQVSLKGMGTGTIVWDNGRVSIQATAIKGKPEIEGGEIVSLEVGG